MGSAVRSLPSFRMLENKQYDLVSQGPFPWDVQDLYAIFLMKVTMCVTLKLRVSMGDGHQDSIAPEPQPAIVLRAVR
jgi:hypothetical protein